MHLSGVMRKNISSETYRIFLLCTVVFMCIFSSYVWAKGESHIEKLDPIPLLSDSLTVSCVLPIMYYSDQNWEFAENGGTLMLIFSSTDPNFEQKKDEYYPGRIWQDDGGSAYGGSGVGDDDAPVEKLFYIYVSFSIDEVIEQIGDNWEPEQSYALKPIQYMLVRMTSIDISSPYSDVNRRNFVQEVFFTSFSPEVIIDKDCEFTLSGNPVDIFTGEKRESATDMSISHGSVNWSFSRNYCNQEFKRSMVGYKWFTNWDKRIFMTDRDADGIVAPLDNFEIPDFLDESNNEMAWVIYPENSYHYTYYSDADGDLVPDQSDPNPYNAKIPRLFLYPAHNYWWSDKGQSKNNTSPQNLVWSYSPNDSAKIYLPPINARSGGMSNLDLSKTIYVYDGRGSGMPYYFNNTTQEYMAPTGRSAKLNVDFSNLGAKIVVRYDNGSVETYHGFHNPPLLTDGKLYSIQDIADHTVTLSYDAFGRITQFKDDQDKVIASFLYWDQKEFESEEDYYDSEKANLLKKIIDYSGHTINYDYDSDGNLESVDNEGRVTRYDYYRDEDYEYITKGDKTFSYLIYHPELRNNLKSVTKPREVNSGANTPFKIIKYGIDSTKDEL